MENKKDVVESTMQKLSQCPFCGSDDISIRKEKDMFQYGAWEEEDENWKVIACNTCGAASGMSVSEQVLLAKWNTRVHGGRTVERKNTKVSVYK